MVMYLRNGALKATPYHSVALWQLSCHFMQDLLDKGMAFSTIKVYLVAISTCHINVTSEREIFTELTPTYTLWFFRPFAILTYACRPPSLHGCFTSRMTGIGQLCSMGISL